MTAQDRKPTLFCLMGPTASGKTDLALRLAEHHSIEIISVDSALVYTGMDIGTGKPSAAMLAKVPHHLIDICDPTQPYNAGKFRADALVCIEQILARGNIPVLVGGTMMYFKALLSGLASLPTSDPVIRAQLDEQAKQLGWPALHARLNTIDPRAAQNIKATDAQRVQRALEVYLISGKSLSDWIAQATPNDLPYNICSIGFIPSDAQRKILHTKIEQRFLQMLEDGLVEEVKKLLARGDLSLDSPAMRSVGYRQVWEYLSGEYDFETMKAKAIAATRQLAKRQITWLRSWPDLVELDFFDEDALLKLRELVSLRTVI